MANKTLAFIALGSNLANPLKQVKTAIGELHTLPNTCFITTSSLYRSPALGPGIQPDYINAVAAIDTELSPQQLLQALQAIEQQHQRRKCSHWQARTLDLDILLFGKFRTHSPSLIIPHPRLMERNFVLYPLFEIAPNLIFPNGVALADIMQNIQQHQLQKITDENGNLL